MGKKIDSVKPIMRWAQEHLNTPENIRCVEAVAHSLTASEYFLVAGRS